MATVPEHPQGLHSGLSDGEIRICVMRIRGYAPGYGRLFSYQFAIIRCADGQPLGEISLILGMNQKLYYAGNIGYNILPRHRGHRYARKACKLVLRFAARHGMGSVLITCNPDNTASLRTIQGLNGASFVETVPVPQDHPLRQRGDVEKCVFSVPTVSGR